MTDSTDTFRLVSYNCRGWNSGIGLLRDIAPEFDLCMIQEHWLFAQQIGFLNFDPAFTSCGVSGMDDDVASTSLTGSLFLCVLSNLNLIFRIIYRFLQI